MNITDLASNNAIHNVWVMNTTKGPTKGNVVFNVPKANGDGVDTIVVPQTFIPIELTELTSKQQLVDSNDFRRALYTGLLSLIPQANAVALLKKTGAKEERERIRRESANTLGAEMLGIPTDTSVLDEDADVVPAVYALMADVSEDTNQMEVINSLRSLASELTVKDYEYVKGIAGKSNLARLGKFCKVRISSMEE